ncbi:MAG: peptidylprolyl isomerase [Rhizonema sp. NSF051]|nr:peptidylprolyl isomerase [Rhizonema sp. NSF051]
MSQTITITNEDILEQVKLSCKTPEIVEQIVARKIIANATAKMGIEVETEELQKAADKLRLANKLNNADDTWAWLEKHSLSLEEFEKIVDNAVISGKLAAHLFADKVEPYFFQNQLDYTNVVMYEVILDDEDLAIELFYAIQEDEMSFYDVAHKYIQDTELRRKGGYRGIVRRKDLKPEISAVVFAAKPPQVLKPIVTSSGVYLIFAEEIIQPQLDKQQRQQILSELLGEWLKQQVEQVELEIALNKSKLVTDVVYNQSSGL